MPNAIEQLGTLTVGHVGLGERSGGIGSVAQQVVDGDTIGSRALGNLPVRFLGIDAPESKLPLPGEKPFKSIGSPGWVQYLTDPFNPALPPLNVGTALRAYLQGKAGAGTAGNHKRHADAAQTALEEEITKDISEQGKTVENFRFFVAFAGEIMDQYGRLLGFINREQQQTPRPPDYNMRLLARGLVNPYFIWPNVDPYREQGSLIDAVPAPGDAANQANQSNALRSAREAVQAARVDRKGIFDQADPLTLEAFELRYLSRRQPPFRWIVDIGQATNVIRKPESYHLIPNSEDRLYIPPDYLLFFTSKGWTLET